MKKRIIASILTVIMLMTMLPTAAFAADGASENTYEVLTADDLSTALTKIEASADRSDHCAESQPECTSYRRGKLYNHLWR